MEVNKVEKNTKLGGERVRELCNKGYRKTVFRSFAFYVLRRSDNGAFSHTFDDFNITFPLLNLILENIKEGNDEGINDRCKMVFLISQNARQ